MNRLWLIASIAALASCTKQSAKYCEMHPDDHASCPALPIDAPMACKADQDCAPGACDLTNQVCVACNTNAQCTTAAAPVCTNHACGKCTAHDQCDSRVCLFDSGMCADPSSVAYARAQGTGTSCTETAPCADLQNAVAQHRAYIKLEGADPITSSNLSVIDTKTTIYADRGTKLRRSTNGTILEVKDTADVTIYDLEISNATGAAAHGITMVTGTPKLALHRVLLDNNSGNGLFANVGTVTMTRSVITRNAGGGANIQLTSTFSLMNNVIAANGSTTSMTGGLTISTGAPTYQLQFNTIADNASSSVTIAQRGINCVVPLNVGNTILVNNRASTSNCTFTYSLSDLALTGVNNKLGDPAFLSTDGTMPSSQDFYRLTSTSAAIGAADPSATLLIDIDGDMRPQQGSYDSGADEFKP